MYAVILAGGGGTRLWPLSDPQHPKPFLPLFPERRHSSLLQKTVDRLTDGAELGLAESDLTVLTDRRYEGLVRAQVPGVTVLSEPVGRNTAAAIAYAVLAVERDFDEVMVVLPADHLVQREDVFREVLASAEVELARGAFGIESPIVTLGAQPDGPSTHYGYLVPDPDRQQWPQGGLHSYLLKEFAEKPDVARATQLLRTPDVSWNAGIFMARRRAFLDALGRYTGLLDQLRPALGNAAALAAAYDGVAPVSIDYAVMEPAAADGLVVMAGMDVGWSDVGTWRALLDALVAGYHGAARVVPPTESVALASGDLAVLRKADNRLVLEAGPRELRSAQPIGLLPDARPHAEALTELLARVNDRTATPVEARA
jgi:mannose-1-phosphate guanylyltransferase